MYNIICFIGILSTVRYISIQYRVPKDNDYYIIGINYWMNVPFHIYSIVNGQLSRRCRYIGNLYYLR